MRRPEGETVNHQQCSSSIGITKMPLPSQSWLGIEVKLGRTKGVSRQ
jgi:hypothetical protein